MILEELTLRNWRGFREAHTFSFAEGFNLVVGRNEAGKSTLFEALTRGFFDRHSSKSEEIKQMQPIGSSLNPEVTIVFRTGRQRYKVFKRFLGQCVSQLYVERSGRWELDHEGDNADAELRTILRGEAAGRTAKPEHRGLAEALWYLQREAALPQRAWAAVIKQGISGLVQLLPMSPEESRILRSIESSYSDCFTPTGRIKSGTELANLQESIPQREQELAEVRARAEGVESLRSELEGLTEAKTDKEMHLQKALSELETLKQGLKAADVLEEQKRAGEKAVHDAEEKLRRVTSDHETIVRRNKETEQHGQALEMAKRASDTCEADARQEHLAAQRHHENWKNDHEPALQKLEEDLSVLQAVERLRKLEKEGKRLQVHLSKVRKIAKELQDKKREMTKAPAPTRKEWDAFQDNVRDLHVAQAQAAASAIRVGFELKNRATKVTAKPEAQRTADNDEFLVTEPTTFTIQNIGRVQVKGGGTSIEELDARMKKLDSLISATLDRFKVSDKQALSDLCQQRLDLEKDVKRLQKALDDLTNQEKDAEQELARTKAGIEEESTKVKAASREWNTWGGQRIREKEDELEKEKKRVVRLIKEEQGHEEEANKAHADGARKAAEASNQVAELQSSIKSLQKENAETLKTYGTVDQLMALATQTKNELRRTQESLEATTKDYESRVETPRKLHQQGVERVTSLEKQLVGIESDIVRYQARIEEAAAQSLYTHYADLEAELEAKRRRRESLERRANGVKILRDMIGAYRKEESAALAAPVGSRVNKWLKLLSEDVYDVVNLNEELFPIAVHSIRYGEKLPLDSLSYGTYEQIIVLLRLALGVLLSKNERNLVVIDDRLVNADPIRMKRLCLILQEVATTTCQVVVATCNDSPYAGIGGKTIKVPSDGKKAAA